MTRVGRGTLKLGYGGVSSLLRIHLHTMVDRIRQSTPIPSFPFFLLHMMIAVLIIRMLSPHSGVWEGEGEERWIIPYFFVKVFTIYFLLHLLPTLH